MSDFSGYTPVYVRSSGNDTTGDGSLGSPYLTVKKGFEKAFTGVGGVSASPATPHIITVTVPASNTTIASSSQVTVVEIADSTGTTLSLTVSITNSSYGGCTGTYTSSISEQSPSDGAAAIASDLSSQMGGTCGYSFVASGSQLTITAPVPAQQNIQWDDTTKSTYVTSAITDENFSLSGDAIASTVSDTSSIIGSDASYVILYINYYDSGQSSSASSETYVDFTAYATGSNASSTASSLASSINNTLTGFVTASSSGSVLTITSAGVGAGPEADYSQPTGGIHLQEGNIYYSGSLINGNIVGSISSSSNTAGADPVLASPGSGNYVVDVGSGNFDGFSLNGNFNSPSWPSRIAIRGAGASFTVVGSISGDAINHTYDPNDISSCTVIYGTEACSLEINSNKTITLGNLSSNGMGSTENNNCTTPGSSPDTGNGGSISLSGIICGNITSNGGILAASSNGDYRPQGNGGTITLIDVSCSGVNSNGSNGGYISLTDCAVSSTISASGLLSYDTVAQSSNTFPAISGGLNGDIVFAGSTNIPNTIIGNVITTTNLRKGKGINGSSILGLP